MEEYLEWVSDNQGPDYSATILSSEWLGRKEIIYSLLPSTLSFFTLAISVAILFALYVSFSILYYMFFKWQFY